MHQALRRGLELHQRGNLAEAEQVYRQILAIEPTHADALHLLGTLAQQVGRSDIAVDLIGKAIAADRRQAAFHSNLGTALQALGRLDEAAVSFRNAMALKPDLAEAHMNLGTVLEAQGKQSDAEARFRRALALKPSLAEAHVNLGNILLAQGKLEAAEASQKRALALKPDFAVASFNLANALQAQGKLDEAVAQYQRALALTPDVAEVHCNLGNALLANSDAEGAISCYERALALKPGYADAIYNLGNARQAGNKLEDAVICYRRALALKPQLPEAHYNLGNTLHALERLDEAVLCFQEALALRPRYAEAQYNLGCVLKDMGRLAESLTCIGKALEIKPDYPQARFAQALAQLQSADFQTGWPNYETRWQSEDHRTPMRKYPVPLWKGERLDAGRLLLWGEQGVGDEIQFASLFRDAIRTGNSIVLDCDPRLVPLFARSFPAIEVISSGSVDRDSSQLPRASIAAHLPTGSLPGLFRTDEASFSTTATPYLKPDAVVQKDFRNRYADGRMLVGLAWHTSNPRTGRRRSIDLSRLAPLFARDDLRGVSLQYGDLDNLEQQAKSAGLTLLIDRTVDQFADIDRFAAQVSAMDLVITVDNSTAHLASALGIPVWLLLPFAADWRWLQERTSSPWYPKMRIFRQARMGDWESVLAEVRQSLAARFARAQEFEWKS
jgi:tetratricopeptide (TPR) repeat protein